MRHALIETDPALLALLFLIGSLATYRLSLMISKESGPARIFRRLRNLAPPKSATKEGLSCQLCMSIWFAAVIAVFYWWRGFIPAPDAALWGLAFSGTSIVIHMHTTKNL